MPQIAGLHVFRDARRELAGPALAACVAAAVGRLREGPSLRSRALEALLLAGELECALADLEDAAAAGAGAAARVTDAIAEALVEGRPPRRAVAAELDGIHPPPVVSASRPEGFAYYALHPLDLASLADELPVRSRAAGVVGVRTIGSTLSAVVAAALRRRGIEAARVTVRPGGHPLDRSLALHPAARKCIRSWIAAGAELLVVDEGPGLSGSTFLATGEALVAEGAAHERVTFLCTRAPDPDLLAAPGAGARARRFRWRAVAPPSRIPEGAAIAVSGGGWRDHLCAGRSRWPACWPAFERLKFLSIDRRRLHKFEGLAHHGAEPLRRARLVAAAGFGPPPHDEGDGFASYPLLAGRPLGAGDLSPAVLDHLAEYCAFRAAELSSPAPDGSLERAFHSNLDALGTGAAIRPPLPVERPVIPDGRMLPHELILAPDGALRKVDACSHGDDHFLPGPADIAWDLAGAILEWRMDPGARDAFLRRYARASGDDAAGRLPAYLLAYASFRLAITRMAAASSGPDEARRLARD
ncbi:MAG: hypothetical protein IT372_16490, partial [Polyangiaceae bacterium]|nr:hypothetical protein [Polyangiaceae bacterium]